MFRQTYAIVARGLAPSASDPVDQKPQSTNSDSIRRQIMQFKLRDFDVAAYFSGKNFVCGTLNLSVSPSEIRIARPKHFFDDVRWTDKLDRPGQVPFVESFYIDEARIVFNNSTYAALLYMPDPLNKPPLEIPQTVIEVIAETIPSISYGCRLMLEYAEKAITVR